MSYIEKEEELGRGEQEGWKFSDKNECHRNPATTLHHTLLFSE
jgi:hypothetical protein